MSEQLQVVNGNDPTNLTTVSRNLGNGVKDAIKRLSQAQNGDSPDHSPSPTYNINRLALQSPQISIEHFDSEDSIEYTSKGSTLSNVDTSIVQIDETSCLVYPEVLPKPSDQLKVVKQMRTKSHSLPMGLTLEESVRDSIVSSSTCDTHEDSDVSVDELQALAELDSSFDIDSEMSVVVKSKQKRNGPISKKPLKHTDSMNSEMSAMDSCSDMSSEEEDKKSYIEDKSMLDPDDDVFNDAENEKCLDADVKLVDWACHEFSPSCRTLLQHCADENDPVKKSSQIQFDLRNLSNRINYFCTEQQRLSGQIKAFMLRGISSSISTDQFLKIGSDKCHTLNIHQPSSAKTSTSSDSPSTSGRESGESQYDHRNYAVKVLRSVSQSLILPLLRDAESGFTTLLYQAIVQALQKISWKVEACLTYNDPTKKFQIHSQIFNAEETAKVKRMMIGVFPPEQPNLQTTARSRSGSLSGSKSKDTSPRKATSLDSPDPQRVIKRTPSGRMRPSGTVFDSGSLPEDFKISLTESSEAVPIETSRMESVDGLSGEDTPVAQSLENTPRIQRSRTATLGDGDLSQSWKSRPLSRYGSTPHVDKDGFPIEITPDYFRPKKARRTTVSLSKREVTRLGLTVAKRVDETIVTETNFRLSGVGEGQSPNEDEEEVERVRERLHAKLTEKFDKIKVEEQSPPQTPYSRLKSASMSDLLDDTPISSDHVARRHDSYKDNTRKTSLDVLGCDGIPTSPGPYSPSFTQSYMCIQQQKDGAMLDQAVSNEWVYLEGNHHVDPRVARGSTLRGGSPLKGSPLQSPAHHGKKTKKKQKNSEKSKKNLEKPVSHTSGRFSESLRKTAQALRRMSTSVPKTKSNLTTTVEVGSLDMLLETKSTRLPGPRPKSSMSEPPSPLAKTREEKTGTMPHQKRSIGTLFRGNKPSSKSFSKGDSLSRKRKGQRSGFLEGYQDISGVNVFADSIDLQYSNDAEVDKLIQSEVDKELLISVEVAGKQPSKASRKRLSISSPSSGGSWFEVTVTTNIKIFGRPHYTILRTFKQVQSLFDELEASHALKLPERPDKKKDLRKQCLQMQDFFRYVSGNTELRESKPFVMFLMPDDEFGSFTDNGSEVSFELIMTFYTPDNYPGPPGSHREVDVVLPENTPTTPSPSRTRKHGTLKRGTLHVLKKEGREESSTFVIREEDKDALIVACEDERYVVVAGTFDKLVEQLACEEKPDPRFVSTLLLGYRHFSSSVELLAGLLRRFHLELPPDATDEEIVYAEKWRYVIQLRVLDILTYWIKKCWPDFYRHKEVLDLTDEFIEDLKSSTDPNFQLAGTNLEIVIKEKSESSPEVYSLTTPLTTPCSSRPPSTPSTPTRHHPVATLDRVNEQGSPISQRGGRSPVRSPSHHAPDDIHTLTAIQLARQLTLIELDFLKLITTHELAVYTWESNDAANKPYRKNLDNFIARFNKVSYWVASEICSVNDAKIRGALIEKFIEIAKQCQEHKNFNTTVSIVTGLSLAAVRRLKRSWEFVGEKSTKSYHKLTSVTSPSNNHGNYRKMLSTVHRKDACIPYFGVFIRDLIFFNDGNTKKLKNGLFNFSKLRTMVLKFEELKRYQRSKYFFPPEDRTREFCRNLWSLSESDLYESSLQVEPRDAPHPASPETDV